MIGVVSTPTGRYASTWQPFSAPSSRFQCFVPWTSVARETDPRTTSSQRLKIPANGSSRATLDVFGNDLDDGLPDDATIQRWNRVTNQLAHRVHLVGPELIIFRKTLKQGCLSHRDRVSATIGMAESSLTKGFLSKCFDMTPRSLAFSRCIHSSASIAARLLSTI